MADPQEARRRPGGRSARIVAAVHGAVNELMADSDSGQVTVTEIAERAGVNPTSIYRRWGTLEALILDVEATRLALTSPMPDTGTLRGDLLTYAGAVAAEIARPGGLAFLRALIGARDLTDEQRTTQLRDRAAQFQEMLDRARDRGEPALELADVLDCILAPIYLRTLLGVGAGETDLNAFVDRALASTTPHHEV
jgi:AcrR family transcriptional regulator